MSAQELADYLQMIGAVHTVGVYQALRSVDRRLFVPDGLQAEAYEDRPLDIGFGQTISQPYTVAFMLELLAVQPCQKVLDVGSGSGWTTALLAYLTGDKGRVYGLERIPELVELGKDNLSGLHFPQSGIALARAGVFGLPEAAPFDRILVSAGADELPDELIDQLAAPGVLVVPVGNAILKLTKNDTGDVAEQRHEGFAFVPLVR